MSGDSRPLIHGESDVLGLEELLESLVTALAAETGGLDAAERGSWIGHEAAVDADHADIEPFADGHRPGDVGGEDITGQSVVGVVRERDGLVDRVDGAT